MNPTGSDTPCAGSAAPCSTEQPTVATDPGGRADVLKRLAADRAELPTVPGYELLELVGRGGMGQVYRARHLGLGRIVALKLLAGDADDSLLSRFREETLAVARLQHPNIAQLYESGTAKGRPYFAQEFLEGGSLAEKLAGKPQPPDEAAALLETVARAVHHSHSEGILHRDLKPGNILLAADGTPKVADFGLAKPLPATDVDTRTEARSALTRTGEVLGTPNYMSPEQASGVVSRLGPGTDVYALGAVLYEMLTGRPPFQAPDILQTLLMVLTFDPVPPRVLQPRVPRDLETICLKCLEKEPARRYASAAGLADDLRRFLAAEPILARPLGPFGRAAKWGRRRPAAAALVGVSGVLLLVLVAAAVTFGIGYVKLRKALSDKETANENLERVNTDLTTAKDETQQTLDLTLTALDRYFFEFSDRLKNVPKGEKLRRDVLDQARRTLDGLHQNRPNDPTIQNYRMVAYGKLGDQETQMGNLLAAETDHATSRDIAIALEARFPGNPLYTRNRAVAIVKIANLRRNRGDEEGADALLDSIIPLLNDLVGAHPNEIWVLELEELVSTHLLQRELQNQRSERALARKRELCDIARRLAAADPANPARKLNVIDADRLLVGLLMYVKKIDEAGEVLARVKEATNALPDHTAVPVRILRAAVHRTIGDYEAVREKYPQAIAAYSATLAEYESLATASPDSPHYRYEQAKMLYYLGDTTTREGDVRAAVKYLEGAETLLAALMDVYPDNAGYRELHNRVVEDLKKVRPPKKSPSLKP